jgi:hypothetical protein
MPEDSQSLGSKLTNLGYEALFTGADHERLLDEIWASTPQQVLERLAGDTGAHPLERFLSSQILLRKDMTFLSRADLHSLTGVYVQALLGNYTGTMTDWGFLRSNEDLGVTGSVFLLLREQAVDQLARLLRDTTVVAYERPSPDASGFDRTRLQRVRIKDFAALYLSKIKNFPVTFEVTFEKRDEEITRLKRECQLE